MKNQGNMTPSKEHKNFLVTDPQKTGICNLSDKLEMFVFSKLSKLQENKENSMKSERWIGKDDTIFIYALYRVKYYSATRAGNPAVCNNMDGAGGH